MPKLVYPTDGLYNRCNGNISRANNHLVGAVSNCNFDIPSNFPYKNYLNGLDDKLRGYRQELGDVKIRIKKVDENFRALASQSEIGAARLIVSKVARRDRLIK